jgi:hypothetical protein
MVLAKPVRLVSVPGRAELVLYIEMLNPRLYTNRKKLKPLFSYEPGPSG